MKRTLPLILLGVLLIFCTWIQSSYLVPTTGGTDQNGYHVCAMRFQKDGVFWQKPVDNLQFIGSMWVVNERGEYYPKYPPLYPAVLAAANEVFGNGAGFYVTSLALILSVAAMFVLGSFFAGRWFGLSAAFMLAFSPVFEVLGITRNSHTPSAAMLLWGLCAFFLGVKHRKKKWSFFCVMLGGTMIGYTVGIRYTDFLLIFIPAAYLFCYFRGRLLLYHLAALGCGAAIPFFVMAVFHWKAYGAPWRSGYSLTAESGAFQIRFMLDNLQIYVPQFCAVMAGPACAAALFIKRFRWRRGVFWCVWLLPTFLLYLTYYWAPDGANTGTLRFIVPLLPAVILLAILNLRRYRYCVSSGTFITGFLLLITIHGVWGWSFMTSLMERKASSDLAKLVLIEEIQRKIPAGACIIAGEGWLNELDFEQKWVLYSSSLFSPNDIRSKIKRSLEKQAAGLQKSRAEDLEKRLGKMNWGQLYKFWRDFFEGKQKDGREVWFIGRTWEVNRYIRIFNPYFEFERKGGIMAERDPWIIREIKHDASRYYTKDKPVPLLNMEIIRLGRKRKAVLPRADRLRMLQMERSELATLLNPDRDPVIAEKISRLEANKSERDAEYRAMADDKKRAELRAKKKKDELKRKAELKKKRRTRKEQH